MRLHLRVKRHPICVSGVGYARRAGKGVLLTQVGCAIILAR